jgi:hypothetical protein
MSKVQQIDPKSNRVARIRALRDEADELEREELAERVAAKLTPAAPPAPATAPLLLTKAELCQHLKRSQPAIDKYDREGQPHYYVGDSKRYVLADVLAWHAERAAKREGLRPAPNAYPERTDGVVRLTKRARRSARTSAPSTP